MPQSQFSLESPDAFYNRKQKLMKSPKHGIPMYYYHLVWLSGSRNTEGWLDKRGLVGHVPGARDTHARDHTFSAIAASHSFAVSQVLRFIYLLDLYPAVLC